MCTIYTQEDKTRHTFERHMIKQNYITAYKRDVVHWVLQYVHDVQCV